MESNEYKPSAGAVPQQSPYMATTDPDRPSSSGGPRPTREKHRVRFTPGGESLDSSNHKATFDLPKDESTILQEQDRSDVSPMARSSTRAVDANNSRRMSASPAHDENLGHEQPDNLTSAARESSSDPEADMAPLQRRSTRGRPISRGYPGHLSEGESPDDPSDNDNKGNDDNDDGGTDRNAADKVFSQKTANDRAERLSRVVGTHSAPASRHTSPVRSITISPPPSPPPGRPGHMPIDLSDIPLEKLHTKRTRYGIEDETDDEEERNEKPTGKPHRKVSASAKRFWKQVQSRTHRRARDVSPPLQSGQSTPVYERDPDHYVPKPKQYRDGYLSSIMKLYDDHSMDSSNTILPRDRDAAHHLQAKKGDGLQPSKHLDLAIVPHPLGDSPQSHGSTPTPSPGGSPQASGAVTPKTKHQKWYYKNQASASTGSIAGLVGSSTVFAQPGKAIPQARVVKPKQKHKPRSTQAMDAILGKKRFSLRGEESIKIQIHIAETIQRHEYIIKMCRALMTYGAPTHRLEEYMRMSARVLEIEGQFLYIPGCMIVSFDDANTHTTEVKIVRATQAVNLGKLRDAHEIYKEVVHDTIGVDEAMQRLDEIVRRKNQYSPWTLVLVYGLASACVGPFAFQARPIDLPIAFFLGSLLGFMQLILAPHSELYSNIFEISAAVLTSFLARAFGSIAHGQLFCFSALAQSAIALILPGYTVLCASLELQSKSIVAGSVRMVYAVIFSLFLGFGITIGTSFYGWADKAATSATTCGGTTWPIWWQIIFVPPFTLCLIVINQGKVKQMPIMVFIALVGWVVNHYSAERFASNAQIANTLGALAIGVLGNLYSRLRHGLAAAALLPAIFVQVPSGLAASGSLVSGVTSADQIVNRTYAGITTVNNGTQAGQADQGAVDINSAVLNVGYSMIQVSIGITVGLFLSALVVYPFGKRRSGLFSF